MIREDGSHLFFTLEVFEMRIAYPVRIRYAPVVRRAQEGIMRYGVVLGDIMNVIGRNDLDAQFGSKTKDAFACSRLFRNQLMVRADIGPAVVGAGEPDLRPSLMERHFEVEILSEQLLVPGSNLLCLVVVSRKNGLRDFPAYAGGGADKVLVVLLQQLVRNPWPGIVVPRACRGAEFHQIVITLEVLGKED